MEFIIETTLQSDKDQNYNGSEFVINEAMCYFGVSINNSFFWSSKTQAYLNWIASNFEDCIILFGGLLQRYNEQIFSNISIEKAILDAKTKEKKLVSKFESELSLIDEDIFKVLRWENLIESEQYTYHEKILNKAFKTNEYFRKSIIDESSSFLNRARNAGKKIAKNKHDSLELSSRYILEELAVFSVLISQGYKTQVYPGTQLKILKDFANGAFNDIDSPLKNGIYIDLTVKKVKS